MGASVVTLGSDKGSLHQYKHGGADEGKPAAKSVKDAHEGPINVSPPCSRARH